MVEARSTGTEYVATLGLLDDQVDRLGRALQRMHGGRVRVLKVANADEARPLLDHPAVRALIVDLDRQELRQRRLWPAMLDAHSPRIAFVVSREREARALTILGEAPAQLLVKNPRAQDITVRIVARFVRELPAEPRARRERNLRHLVGHADDPGPGLLSLLDAMEEGLLVTDEAGQVLFATPAAESLLGRLALKGTPIGAPSRLDDTFHIETHPPQGPARTLEARARRIRWGATDAYLSVLVDVSERDDHKQLIDQVRDWFGQTLEKGVTTVCRFDAEGQLATLEGNLEWAAGQHRGGTDRLQGLFEARPEIQIGIEAARAGEQVSFFSDLGNGVVDAWFGPATDRDGRNAGAWCILTRMPEGTNTAGDPAAGFAPEAQRLRGPTDLTTTIEDVARRVRSHLAIRDQDLELILDPQIQTAEAPHATSALAELIVREASQRAPLGSLLMAVLTHQEGRPTLRLSWAGAETPGADRLTALQAARDRLLMPEVEIRFEQSGIEHILVCGGPASPGATTARAAQRRPS